MTTDEGRWLEGLDEWAERDRRDAALSPDEAAALDEALTTLANPSTPPSLRLNAVSIARREVDVLRAELAEAREVIRRQEGVLQSAFAQEAAQRPVIDAAQVVVRRPFSGIQSSTDMQEAVVGLAAALAAYRAALSGSVEADTPAEPDELRARARDLYRRSDNVPLSVGIDRVGQLREEADALMRRADEIEATREVAGTPAAEPAVIAAVDSAITDLTGQPQVGAAYAKAFIKRLAENGVEVRPAAEPAPDREGWVSVTWAELVAGVIVGVGGEHGPFVSQEQAERAADLIMRSARRALAGAGAPTEPRGPLVAVRVGPADSGHYVGPFAAEAAVAWQEANVTAPGQQWAIVPLLADLPGPLGAPPEPRARIDDNEIAAGKLRIVGTWCAQQGWGSMARELNDLASDFSDLTGSDEGRDYSGPIAALVGRGPDHWYEPAGAPTEPSEFVDVVLDGPPDHVAGRFVEVENPEGRSIDAGRWFDRGDGTWALRIQTAPTPESGPFEAALMEWWGKVDAYARGHYRDDTDLEELIDAMPTREQFAGAPTEPPRADPYAFLQIPADGPQLLARAVDKDSALSGCGWEHVHAVVDLVRSWRISPAAPTEPADPVRDALAGLVSLKDGPRDHRYRARKDWAWSNARAALAAVGIATTADAGKKLVAAEDGKPGCPAEVWDDGIYRNRCSRGIDECGRHGKFAVRPADDTQET